MALDPVVIYTDGACLGNPGPGGYGAILTDATREKELSGGFRLTTNNRMELLATIKGLEALKMPCDVVLWTDSQYVVNGMEKGWAKSWRAKGWIKSDKKPAVNPDLWGRLLDLCEINNVRFQWVRGHNGHVFNERVDRLAFAAAKGNDLQIDEEYEKTARMALFD